MSIAYGQQPPGSQQPNQPSHVPSIAPPNQQHRQLGNRPPNTGPNAGPNAGPPPPNPAHIQKVLDENCSLIQTIQEFQSNGKSNECMQYHQALHRNLVYLAQLAGMKKSLLNSHSRRIDDEFIFAT